jgi:hypothetical protein
VTSHHITSHPAVYKRYEQYSQYQLQHSYLNCTTGRPVSAPRFLWGDWSGQPVSAPKFVSGTADRTAGVCTEICIGSLITQQDGRCLHRRHMGRLWSGQPVSAPRFVWGTAGRRAGVCTENCMGDCGQDSRCLHRGLSHLPPPPKEQSAIETRHKRWFNWITRVLSSDVVPRHNTPIHNISIDYSSIEHLSEGIRNAP